MYIRDSWIFWQTDLIRDLSAMAGASSRAVSPPPKGGRKDATGRGGFRFLIVLIHLDSKAHSYVGWGEKQVTILGLKAYFANGKLLIIILITGKNRPIPGKL